MEQSAAMYEAGIRNLLENCIGLETGQSVLIVGEDHPGAYFDPELCAIVADAAEGYGARPRVIVAPATTGPEDFPEIIAAEMRNADHTIFFSRIGDQVRFCPLPGPGSKTMCYIHDETYLRDEFARTPYGLFREVSALLLDDLSRASTCRITCPMGTELEGPLLPMSGDDTAELTAEFSVTLFPVMITPPLSAAGLNGWLVIDRWLMTTSTRNYEDSLIELDDPLVADVQNGRIGGFDGEVATVERVRRHFERVGSLSGGDAFAVNSWHTGIYPKTFYKGRAADNVQKWGDVAYGSPRYSHFHVCGADPGDIAISLFDATISFDGRAYWEGGRFVYLEEPHVRKLLERYPGCETAFDMRWDIGI